MVANIALKALSSMLAMAFAMTMTRASSAGCGSDADCKGDRICVEASCVDPHSTVEPEATAVEPEAPAVAMPAPASVPAALPAAAGGGVHVTSELPGDIFIDGNGVGRTPATIDGLQPGSHELRVDFDEGGDRKLRVLVRAGRVTDMHVEPSLARIVGKRRSGVSVGVSAGGGLLAGTAYGTFGFGLVGFVLNVGIVPAVDFRTGVRAYVGETTALGDRTPYYEGAAFGVEVPAEVRFNLGSIYSMMIGVAVGTGVYPREDGDESCFYGDCPPTEESLDIPVVFGPSLSLLSFRFGEDRQFEVSATNWMRVHLDVGASLGGTVDFVWLML